MMAFNEIKRGFYDLVPRAAVRYLSREQFEEMMVGMDFIDIKYLKSITEYKGFSERHESAKRFWRVLETFTQEQLSGYLQFVYGRTRLVQGSNDGHKLTFCEDLKGCPESHTCFFELDLGLYESDEQFKEKLLYGIENCKEIAEASGTYDLPVDFAM